MRWCPHGEGIHLSYCTVFPVVRPRECKGLLLVPEESNTHPIALLEQSLQSPRGIFPALHELAPMRPRQYSIDEAYQNFRLLDTHQHICPSQSLQALLGQPKNIRRKRSMVTRLKLVLGHIWNKPLTQMHRDFFFTTLQKLNCPMLAEITESETIREEHTSSSALLIGWCTWCIHWK